jgi:hypothetical protein
VGEGLLHASVVCLEPSPRGCCRAHQRWRKEILHQESCPLISPTSDRFEARCTKVEVAAATPRSVVQRRFPAWKLGLRKTSRQHCFGFNSIPDVAPTKQRFELDPSNFLCMPLCANPIIASVSSGRLRHRWRATRSRYTESHLHRHDR